MMAAEKKSGTSPDEIETQANILYTKHVPQLSLTKIIQIFLGHSRAPPGREAERGAQGHDDAGAQE